tara:strand:+ start:10083 stop:12230 length:2148 start_codon:yes stop_codon:yes gene_type:complete
VIFRSRYSIGKVSKVSKKSVGARFQSRKRKIDKTKNIFKKIIIFSTAVGFVLVCTLCLVIFNITKTLPDVEAISTYIPAETTKIYSEDGIVLAELHKEENRVLIPIERISPILTKTIVVVEDNRFYRHNGLDFFGIARAFVRNFKAKRFVEGGSTLTQQLARNLFLTRQRNLSRKLAEAILAIQIERRYTKTEILQMYLNQVYWGHNAYGIESASRLYFGKSAEEINLAESSLLVSILTGPELYSPIRNFEGAKKRQLLVLKRMVKEEFITSEEANEAYTEELAIIKRKKLRYKAPYFTAYIIKQLIEMYGEEVTYTSGMKIYTTLDYSLQQKAEEVVQKYIEYGESSHWIRSMNEKVPSLNYSQASLLAIDPRYGYIKTMVGGKDFLDNQFNRTTQAKRQPGSAFKPFIYLTALEKGFSPGSIIEDAPVTFNTIEGPYAPHNYTQKYKGPMSIRKALERSVNIVSIKLNYLIGPKNSVRVAKALGIKSPLKPVLSLPLGANEVTMMELVSAYGTIATLGNHTESTGIIRIEDRDGTPLYEHNPEIVAVYDSNLLATLVEMMKGIVKYGTGKLANLPRPVAGKTGTTSDYRDAWFVGFVPQLVCATWIGNDDNSETVKVTGGWVPALMWKEFMTMATQKMPAQDFPRPKGLVSVKIDWLTGKLATQFSPKEYVYLEKFWSGKEPKEYDTADEGFWDSGNQKETNDDALLQFFDNG